jgi:3-keto-5-aminohexanoate cleavage enzyme
LHKRMQERGIVPEYEIFDLGHLAALHRLLDEHGAPAGGHVHVDLVMGVPGGMPGDVETLVAALRLLPTGATFSATGIGRTSLPVMLASLAGGGHLRVGMEDTVSYARGERVRDNAQLVARAAGLARIAQRPPMSPAEVRTLLRVAQSN